MIDRNHVIERLRYLADQLEQNSRATSDGIDVLAFSQESIAGSASYNGGQITHTQPRRVRIVLDLMANDEWNEV